MLVNFTEVQNIFIVCGHTDMRCGIDGLASVVSDKYNLDLFNDATLILRKFKISLSFAVTRICVVELMV